MTFIRLLRPAIFPPLIATALGAAFALGHGGALAQSIEKGKVAYVKNGCWQCHGFVGQGGAAGPKLAPDPRPLDVLSIFVRNSAGAMPPYTATILSDQDLADIHAYLKSIPKAVDYKSIPLLN